MFLYADSTYDDSDPWKGLLRSQLLINVNISLNRADLRWRSVK